MPTHEKGTALILAGAVAKGAFGAGAIAELVGRGVTITRIVATSSGALNGVVLAGGIRAGAPDAAAARLTTLWSEKGSWQHVFHPSLRGLAGATGLSDGEEILDLLRAHVHPTPEGAVRRPVDLAVVVAAAWGSEGRIGTEPATTYEKVLSYSGACFDTAEGLDEVFRGALASCAFPGVFVPVDLPGVGPCFDGGAVDNAPVAAALGGTPGDGTPPIERVIVVAPSPRVMLEKPSLHGTGLIGHLAEILTEERLYRDLAIAEETNAQLRRFERLRQDGTLSDAAYTAVLHAFDPRSRPRTLEIVQVRPQKHLPGDAFEGFLYRYLRDRYIAAGREAARLALDALDAGDAV